MTLDIYNKYRPKLFKHVYGQERAVAMLLRMFKGNSFPHATLFTGPSGCGKTTLARIAKDKLNCGNRDFMEINAADHRGIDMIRDMTRFIRTMPLTLDGSRVYIIDEAHKLSPDAQNAILKPLEDTPPHAYIMLASTDPAKLLKTIKTRCTEVRCDRMDVMALKKTIGFVLEKENKTISKEVLDKLVETADGSARKVLVILNTIIGLDDDEEQLAAIFAADSENESILIARALMDSKTDWPKMKKILAGVKEDPEGLRRMILSYAQKCMMSDSSYPCSRGYLLVIAFSENYYDNGLAGLWASCYEVVKSGKK